MELLRFELKKILSRRFTQVVCIGCFAFLLIMVSMTYFRGNWAYAYDAELAASTSEEQGFLEYNGRKGVALNRERTAYFEGVWDDARLRQIAGEYQAFLNNPENYSEEIDAMATLSRRYALESSGLSRQEIAAYEAANPLYSFKPAVQWGEYQKWSIVAYWLEQHAYNDDGSIRTMAEAMPLAGENPIYSYHEGAQDMTEFLKTLLGPLLLLMLLAGLAPLFSTEVARGTEPLLLSAKYGRSRMPAAKLLASLIYTLLCLSAMALLSLVLLYCFYGRDGFSMPVQLSNIYASIPFEATFGRYCAMLFGGLLLGGLAIGAVIMALSAAFSSPVTAIFTGALYYVVMAVTSTSSNTSYSHLAQVLPGGTLFPELSLTQVEPFLGAPQMRVAIAVGLCAMVLAWGGIPLRYRNKR